MSFSIMRNIAIISIILTLFVGCRPYRVDIQQGNILDNKALSQLHLGLTKNETKNLLGTPMLTDPFDPNIWLYVYTKQIDGGKIDRKKMVLKFKNDKLILIQ